MASATPGQYGNEQSAAGVYVGWQTDSTGRERRNHNPNGVAFLRHTRWPLNAKPSRPAMAECNGVRQRRRRR
ncbi:hypothetical protein [Rhodoferax sp. U11-2br]|uniref:hypothetical protein n=1 Tax=Rhodoferax sp. U11-2br TaxID=2838878 RepID=UPI001BEBCACD|nr:hypothetical protein [Rhodoferax sp. U11-2br]MBT3068925.1 hypothetical protein [Rhodoferax sp. U11-2br]